MCLSLNCMLMRHTLSKFLHAVVKNALIKKNTTSMVCIQSPWPHSECAIAPASPDC